MNIKIDTKNNSRQCNIWLTNIDRATFWDFLEDFLPRAFIPKSLGKHTWIKNHLHFLQEGGPFWYLTKRWNIDVGNKPPWVAPCWLITAYCYSVLLNGMCARGGRYMCVCVLLPLLCVKVCGCVCLFMCVWYMLRCLCGGKMDKPRGPFI